MSLKKALPLFTFLLINFIFTIKYSERLESISQYLIGVLYLFITLCFVYFYPKLHLKSKYYCILFYFAITLFFSFSIFLNIHVDGYTLNVDRWSAMENAIKALFDGQYPYSAVDHLGGRTSNLPALIFMGIPFYLMGNIGFLQSFGFLLFSFIIYSIFKNYKTRLFILILLISSPAYLWEIYAKSDLMTNFILVLLFLFITSKKKRKGSLSTAYLSFFSTILLLTRLVSVIPLTLLLFKRLWKSTIKHKIIFSIIAILTISILGYICFHQAPNWAYFMQYNPFNLQNRELPLFISIITIVIPIFFSFKIKSFTVLIEKSALFLAIPVFISFILFIIKNGLHATIYQSIFDISYLNIIFPFVIILIYPKNENRVLKVI